MLLSEAGELGLLRELETRGLIVGTERDAAELAGGLVVTQDALVEGVHFRLDWLSWRELGYRAAAVTLSDLSASGARPEALFVTLTLPGDVELERGARALRRVGGDGGSRAGRRHVECRPHRGQRHRARAVRPCARTGGGRPGRSVVDAAWARPAPRSGGPLRPSAAADRGRPPARRGRHAMLDVSDGSPSMPASRSPLRVSRRDRPRRRAARGELDDLGFGEDFELLAATPDPIGFAVIGSCEAGEGVVLLHGGEPYDLPGYEHFA